MLSDVSPVLGISILILAFSVTNEFDFSLVSCVFGFIVYNGLYIIQVSQNSNTLIQQKNVSMESHFFQVYVFLKYLA